MQQKQATGIDTRMMLPVYFAAFSILCQLFFPWVSIPVLKYSRLEPAYTVFQTPSCLESIQSCIANGGKLAAMPPLTPTQMQQLSHIGRILSGLSVFVICLLAICAVSVLCKRGKSLPLVRAALLVQLLFTVVQFGCVMGFNRFLNDGMGRVSSFTNLTLHSYVQLTSWVYAQMFLSLLVLGFSGRLLRFSPEAAPAGLAPSRPIRWGENRRFLLSLALMVLAIPAVIFFGIYFLNDRSSVFIGFCIIGLSMLPFAMIFEQRKPQAREILLISVLSAIAVVGRLAFFMVPQFKPTAAIVILAGVTLGPEAGFLTGAVSAFVSNFLFGQGPWTPWQMFSLGIIGFLAGLLFYKRKTRMGSRRHRALLCLYGGLSVFVIYGLLMDFSSVLNAYGSVTWPLFLARILSGVTFNLIHGAATVIFLFLLAEPFERKLRRIQKKYGLIA